MDSLKPAKRGGNDSDDQAQAEANIRTQDNIVLWFGCPAGDSVDAESTIAKELFIDLKKNANRRDGKVVLPRDMVNTRVGEKGEMTTSNPPNILLEHMDWDP